MCTLFLFTITFPALKVCAYIDDSEWGLPSGKMLRLAGFFKDKHCLNQRKISTHRIICFSQGINNIRQPTVRNEKKKQLSNIVIAGLHEIVLDIPLKNIHVSGHIDD